MAISLNPGFLLLLAAVIGLALGPSVRRPLMLVAALAAAWACFAPPFGEPVALRQIGLALSPLKLDATSQMYGFTALLIAILCAIAAFSRKNRLEDVSLFIHAGGAASAAFAGDLVTFLACACLSALGAAGLVFAAGSAEARNAGVRLMGWHALSGLFLIGGAALLWAQSGSVRFAPVPLATPAGALLFAGLLIQAGAPLAHVWVRDAVSHASGLGGAAAAALAPLAAYVGFARLFPGEAALAPIGVLLACAPLAFALAEPDWRRAAAYGVLSQNGFVVAALGLGTPLALAGAGASAFANALAALGLLLSLGAVRDVVGAERATGPGIHFAARAPSLAAIAVLAASAFLAVPGTASYAARSLVLEAFHDPQHAVGWALLTGAGAAAVAHGGFKAPFAAFFGPRPSPPGREPAFPMLLAAGLCAFVSIATGIRPAWIYDLAPPGNIFHEPFALDALVPQAILITISGAVFLALMWSPIFPAQRPAEILEVDWLWRRPGRRLARLAGAGLKSGYAAFGGLQDRAFGLLGAAINWAASAADRPSAAWARGPGAALALVAIAAAVAALLTN